jgi:restriction endonuclease S subunit
MIHREWPSKAISACLEKVSVPSGTKLQTKDYRSSGRFPVVDQGQELIAGWTDDQDGLISSSLPLVVFGDHTRVFKYVDFPFVRGADGTQLLKPRSEIDPLYFFYACKAIDLPSRGYNRHFTMLKEKEISLPPDIYEQTKIGRLMQSVELCIEQQTLEIANTQELKHASMRELFTRGLRGEAQKETEIGLVPESWDVVDFASVREWLQYGTSVRCSLEPSSYPVLRIPNIEQSRVDVEELKYCDLSPHEAENYRLENGDMIFIRTNGVLDRLGSCAVYAGDPPNALFASYLIRARVLRDVIEPRFAAYFFGSKRGTDLIAGRATPAADGKYNLNTGTIDSIPLPLPPTLDEQREVVKILDAIDHKIDLHKRKKSVLEELFRSLLHKLMTGEIRVADLDLSALDNIKEYEAQYA